MKLNGIFRQCSIYRNLCGTNTTKAATDTHKIYVSFFRFTFDVCNRKIVGMYSKAFNAESVPFVILQFHLSAFLLSFPSPFNRRLPPKQLWFFQHIDRLHDTFDNCTSIKYKIISRNLCRRFLPFSSLLRLDKKKFSRLGKICHCRA